MSVRRRTGIGESACPETSITYAPRALAALAAALATAALVIAGATDAHGATVNGSSQGVYIHHGTATALVKTVASRANAHSTARPVRRRQIAARSEISPEISPAPGEAAPLG
jgi:hypothetical protein